MDCRGVGRRGGEVLAAGRTFEAMRTDCADPEAVRALGADLAGRERPVDILVNNAGTIRRAPPAEHADRDWELVLQVNLNAQFALTRAAGASMVARGQGKVVFTASLLSFQGGITVPGYIEPTTPRPRRTTSSAARRSWTASRPGAGAGPTTSRAPPCSSPRTPPPTSTARSCPSTAEGSADDRTDLAYGTAQGALTTPGDYRVTPAHDAQAAVEAAREAGIRYFDTAPHYGLGLFRAAMCVTGRVTPTSSPPRPAVCSSPTRIRGAPTTRASSCATTCAGSGTSAGTRGVLRSIEDTLERTGLDRRLTHARVAEVCAAHGTASPATAIAFPYSRPRIINVTLGMRTAEQVGRNVELHRQHLPEGLWDDLRARGLIRSDVPAENGPGRSARCL